MLVGMASKRALLGLLSRDELLTAVDLFGVEVPNRRAKDGIVDALVASRKVSLAQALADFPNGCSCCGLNAPNHLSEQVGAGLGSGAVTPQRVMVPASERAAGMK